MILYCSYEELQALVAGAELLLCGSGDGHGCAVAAPPEVAAQVELLLPRLTGDLSVATLAEQQRLRGTVDLIVENLRARMEGEVVEHHPAHEGAVSLYFHYANALKVRERLDRMGQEMAAIIGLTNGTVTREAAASFSFPD